MSDQPNPNDATGNLPNWGGAEAVYSTAYAVLERMARNGHVTRTRYRGRTTCSVSEDMRTLIDALDAGDEEQIKGLLHLPTYEAHRWSETPIYSS